MQADSFTLRSTMIYSGFMDKLCRTADNALRTLSGSDRAARANPAAGLPTAELTPSERRLSGALMRVNHVGEICAQALYNAQALMTSDPAVTEQLRAAAREETDHLAWTQQRLDELGDRPSLLNPLWYAGAFTFGMLAGKAGDEVSLGFVVETERQVEQHLASHLDRLPAHDVASRAILLQMQEDEIAHGELARLAGASELPGLVKKGMRAAASVMTGTAHRI